MKTAYQQRVRTWCSCLILTGALAFGQCEGLDVRVEAPEPGFTAYVDSPLELRVKLTECGSSTPLSNATVIMGVGFERVDLRYDDATERWTGAWTPSVAVTREAAVSFFATQPSRKFGGGQVVGRILPPAPPFTLEQSSLVFNVTSGGGPIEQDLEIVNHTGSELAVDITGSGEEWLSLTSPTVTLPPRGTRTVGVTVNSGALTEGTARAAVRAAAGEASATALVSVAVAPPETPVQLTAAPSSFELTLTAGDQPFTRGVRLLNGGSREAPFTVVSDSPWLTPGLSEGVLAPGLSLSFDVAIALSRPGHYIGHLFVTAGNSPPSLIAADVIVKPQVISLPLSVDQTELKFTGAAAQELELTNPYDIDLDYEISAQSDAPAWLSVNPASGSVAAHGSVTVQVSSAPGPRTAGRFEGALSVRSHVGDGAVATVDIPATLTLRPPGLVLTVLSPAEGAQVPVSQPFHVELIVRDTAGDPVASASVTAVFPTPFGPLQLSLDSTGEGHWAGTWNPVGEVGTPITARFEASRVREQGSPVDAGEAEVSVKLGIATASPVTAAVATNAASFQNSSIVAPGSLISIFGAQLSDCFAAKATSFPLPASLCGTQVLLGGKPLTLHFVSQGQINAGVPLTTPIGTGIELVVSRNNQLSEPLRLTVAPAAPGLFTLSVSGSGAGTLTHQDYQLVTAGNPLHPGEMGLAFATGLGQVTARPGYPPVVYGSPAPPADTVETATVEVGGIPAEVVYSGLLPGFSGAYQINFFVPDGVATGPEVPLTLTIGGAKSNTVTVPIAP